MEAYIMARTKYILDISSFYEQDERLVNVLQNNYQLRRKWLHKMVDSGDLEIVEITEDEEGWQ